MSKLAVPVVIFSLALGLNAFAASPNGQGAAGRPTGVPSQAGVNREVPPAATPMTTSPPRGQDGQDASDIRTEGRSTSELLTNNTKLASQVHDLTGADAQQACSVSRIWASASPLRMPARTWESSSMR